MSTIEREGRYVQHNVGALPDDREDIEEFYLMADTEKRLDASKSTTSFQSFEMDQKRGSFSSQVYTYLLISTIHVQSAARYIHYYTYLLISTIHVQSAARYIHYYTYLLISTIHVQSAARYIHYYTYLLISTIHVQFPSWVVSS